jgi:Tfp pilus assembly protein FimT
VLTDLDLSEIFMKSNSRKLTGQSGASVVETLVVIVIIAIVAALALMQRGSANEQFQRQNVARELKVAFERARFDSVKRRADTVATQAKVLVETDAYTLTTDMNLNGTLESSDDVRKAVSVPGQNVVIAGNGGTTLPVTVSFNQRGEPVDSSGVSISPVFLVCNASCSSPTNANSNIVVLTPTGTVNLLAGGSTIPAFNAPPVTSVPVGTGISNMVSVP